jgi:hypothetical protein
MIIKTLEECVEIFNKIKSVRDNREFLASFNSLVEVENEIRTSEFEILELESIHKKLIRNIASQTQGLDDVLECMKNTNKNIVGQAFLIIIDSKNKIIIQKMIEKYLFDKDKRYDIFQYLVYVSEDGFDILFNTLKKIGFDKTEFHQYVTAFLLKYIRANSLKEYLEIFYKLDNFSEDLQEKILNNLRYFEEFHDVVIQAYKDKHPYFFEDNQYIVETTPFSLLLQKEDTIALNILRQDDNIWHGDDVVLDLILHGNKEDGKVIADALIRFVKDNKFQDSSLDLAYWLYQKLDYTLDISSPLLYKNILEIFRLNFENKDSFEELTALLEYKLLQQFGKFEVKEANSQYEYWLKHPKKDNRKKYLSDSLPISPQLLVLNTLMSETSYSLAPTISYEELIITTGQYFPLNSGGYYSTLKEHAEVWSDYLEKNKEKYKAGRWIRYGKYID